MINLKHTVSGVLKQSPIGFSWTYLFFGFFVPLFRGDIKWFLISFVLLIFTFGIVNFVLCFLYNKIYIKNLLESGYVAGDEFSKSVLINKGYILGN